MSRPTGVFFAAVIDAQDSPDLIRDALPGTQGDNLERCFVRGALIYVRQCCNSWRSTGWIVCLPSIMQALHVKAPWAGLCA